MLKEFLCVRNISSDTLLKVVDGSRSCEAKYIMEKDSTDTDGDDIISESSESELESLTMISQTVTMILMIV